MDEDRNRKQIRKDVKMQPFFLQSFNCGLSFKREEEYQPCEFNVFKYRPNYKNE